MGFFNKTRDQELLQNSHLNDDSSHYREFVFLLNWRFLLLTGILLLAACVLFGSLDPWSWGKIECFRHFLHKNMNSEVYCYYSRKIKILFSVTVFTACELILSAVLIRFIPESRRRKWFFLLKDEQLSGLAGGILIFIFSLGLVIRLANYITNNFWCDTLALTDAVMSTPFHSLITRTLPNMQSAPPGFLLLLKIFGELFGYRELSLGIPSLIAGILSMFLFYRLLKSHFHIRTVLVMCLLFVFNPAQISYSGEIKQYAFDVLFTILLSYLGMKMLRGCSRKLMLQSSIAGIAATWFSHVSFFVVPALGAVLFFCSLSSCEKAYRFRIVILNVIWALAVLISASNALCIMPAGMYVYHNLFFAPLPLNREALHWYRVLFQNIFCYPLGLTFPSLALSLIPFFVILIGAVRLWLNNRRELLMTVLPLLIMFAASIMKQYPIESHDNVVYSRLILFTVPLVYFLFAAGLDLLDSCKNRLFYGITVFCSSSSILLFIFTFSVMWNLNPLYEKLSSEWVEGDKIYISSASRLYIRIHADKCNPFHASRDFPIDDNKSESFEWQPEYAERLFSAPGRYWVFLSSGCYNKETLKEPLSELGLVRVWSESGGVLYCLDKKK